MQVFSNRQVLGKFPSYEKKGSRPPAKSNYRWLLTKEYIMSKVDIARALKDKSYYNSLTAEEKSLVPGNPAGDSALSETDLDNVSGGRGPRSTTKVCHSERTVITGCGCPA
jgi:mersacidin/lichenicidin family type 2 lantibiotic